MENLDLQTEAEHFYNSMKTELHSLSLDLTRYPCDHLCYRVSSLSEYQLYKRKLLLNNELLTEAIIRGRPISTFQLKTPLIFGAHLVKLLELPAPTAGTHYATGFEHAEFVISEPFETFQDRHPVLKSSLKVREHPFNPEMAFPLKGGSIKFHYAALDEVIRLEKLPEYQKQIVIFDLDGTLIDSNTHIIAANKKILKGLGVAPEHLNSRTAFPNTFESLLSEFDLSHLNPIEFSEIWGRELEKAPVALFDGTVKVLEELYKMNIPMALWTARDLKSARSTLLKLGINHYFDRVWAFNSSYPKPKAEGFRYLTGGRPIDYVTYVGDSPIDHGAALTVGCRYRWADEVFDNLESQNKFLDAIRNRNYILQF